MIIPLLIAVVIAAITIIIVVSRHSGKKAVRARFEAQFSSDAIELDPIADAALMGEHYWLRIELFDLLQKGYVEQVEDKLKPSPPALPPGEISGIQQELLKTLEGEDEGLVGGQLLGAVADSELIGQQMQKKQREYQTTGMAYPEEATDDGHLWGCLPIIVGVLIGVGAFNGVFGYDEGASMGAFCLATIILIIPLVVMKFQSDFSEHPPKAQASMALMREKWGGKTIEVSGDVAVQQQNLYIFGALGMGSLAGTGFATFDDAFPLASASGAVMVAGGCGSCSGCSSCGGCGGGGDGGGGGCGGGGCGGGCGG